MSFPTIINAPNPDLDGNPDVATLADGRIAIAYQSRGPDGAFDIVLRVRETDGTLGEEFRPEGDWFGARQPEVTVLSDDTLLLSWIAQQTGPDGPTGVVLAQQVRADGLALTPVFTVIEQPEDSPGPLELLVVAAESDGGFAARVTPERDPDFDFPRYTSVLFEDLEFLEPTQIDVPQNPLNPRPGFDVAEGFRLNYNSRSFAFAEQSPITTNNYLDIPEDYGLPFVERSKADLSLTLDSFLSLGGDQFLVFVNFPYAEGETPPPEFTPFHAFEVTASPRAFKADVIAPDPIWISEDRLNSDAVDGFAAIALADGGWAVTWSENSDVFAQVFDADNQPVGDNYLVAGGPAIQRLPQIAQASDETLFFAWNERDVDGQLDVLSREVALSELAIGEYERETRPFLEITNARMQGDAVEGAVLRLAGDLDSSGRLTETDIQWFRVFDGQAETIEGANGLRYTLTPDEVGAAVVARATIANADGAEVTLSVRLGGAGGPPRLVENLQTPAEGEIGLSGDPVVGATLTAEPEIVDLDGFDPDDFIYAWLRDDEPIPGAFQPTYQLTEEDLGADVAVEIRFRDGFDNAERVLSAPVFVRTPPTDGDDLLLGGSRDETIRGRAGDDRIDAGGGADVVRGDEGADVFVFARGYGADVIEDFAPGLDRVEFDFDGIDRARDLIRAADILQDEEGVTLDLGNGDALTLLGVTRADLSPSDALFV
ncbi:hypothetical protein [Jannaschia seohaensis]|uniref:Hemolysin type calcium-binding protein n=1 Tax=Jannaschia seohaensis TaxID=475081 RepID=A0A2Y9C3C3_9RHOB|nr:hypothetical protein [Jannaschia seohaensis]PWJ12109.1 hypothetical protein BCF38_11742 [Jannaschia seohaensis]SSA51212.1 hypothetical protein SAMN05421539_11742 [Jannaschia seohaensis]